MWRIGLDVHLRQWTYVVLDENGKKIMTRSGRGAWTSLVAELAQIKHAFEIVFEASTGCGHLHDQIEAIPHARRVLVAHPGQLRLIFRSKRKNDRVDADKLAKLLYLGEVPAAYVPAAEVREWRRMIEYRQSLVRERTRQKNQIRALLRAHGATPPKGLWTKKGMAWLEEQEFGTDMDRFQRQALADDVRKLTERIAGVEKLLDACANRHPGVQLLQTIPGVGSRTAEAVMAYVDAPKRFTSAPRMAAYFGLVPCQDASAGVNRLGHITREGPSTARKLLTEAAWQSIRRSPRIRGFFERVMRQDPKRKRIALVATACHLVRVMHSMLTSGETWRKEAA
jgi:transposase